MSDNTKKFAFSVAEAMITILIVSVALAAMAPIMTKKSQNTASGNSKWMFTRNGNDITRVTGNVGIGNSVSTNPSARLEIRNDTSDGAVRIYRGNTMVVQVGASGDIYVNDNRTSGNDSIATAQNGTWRNALRRDGGLYVNAATRTQRALSINSPNGETAWVNADGSSSFGVPSGMVAFFARAAGCPTGWTNLTEWGWGGLYFRVADGANPYNVYQDSQNKWHSHQFRNQMTWDNMNYRNQTIGRGDNGDLLGPYYNEAAILPEGGNEARPRTVPLYGCVRN